MHTYIHTYIHTYTYICTYKTNVSNYLDYLFLYFLPQASSSSLDHMHVTSVIHNNIGNDEYSERRTSIDNNRHPRTERKNSGYLADRLHTDTGGGRGEGNKRPSLDR